MSANLQVVLSCDGIMGAGCPHGSTITLDTTTQRYGRKRANQVGWDWQRITNSNSNVTYVDICPECRKR